MTDMSESFYQEMIDRWPSSIVARERVAAFTDGLISSETMARLDSQGVGPPKFVWQRARVFYEVDHFVYWLQQYITNGNEGKTNYNNG